MVNNYSKFYFHDFVGPANANIFQLPPWMKYIFVPYLRRGIMHNCHVSNNNICCFQNVIVSRLDNRSFSLFLYLTKMIMIIIMWINAEKEIILQLKSVSRILCFLWSSSMKMPMDVLIFSYYMHSSTSIPSLSLSSSISSSS